MKSHAGNLSPAASDFELMPLPPSVPALATAPDPQTRHTPTALRRTCVMSLRSGLQSLRAGSAEPSWLGVTAGSTRLSAAIVQRAIDARPRVIALQTFDGERSMQALAGWRRKRGNRGLRTNLLLNPNDYQILPIEAPEVAAEERAAAARWRIKDMIDFPAEDACVDCLLIPAAGGSVRSRQALAVVTRRDTVSQWMTRSRQSHLDLHAIDIPELALRNLAALLPGDGTNALLHVGLDHTSLVLVWQGELCNSRRFDLGAKQILQANSAVREQLVERLGLDVQRTADAFERQFHAAAVGALWISQEKNSPLQAEELERFVALHVKAFRLAEHLELDTDSPLVDPERGIDFVTAIGAALRQEPLQ